ncbi:MAG: 6,7-dimethyl-8-ribityllumazine synthase [Bacteroidetes bacterium]|nr:6,7-dimethyl-8-ribityllumazine synthase [Bacteroidota bacterium]
MSSAHQSLSSLPKDLPNAGPYQFGIVVAEWNSEITDALLAGAQDALTLAGALADKITIINVPGSFELTAGASLLLPTEKFDAVICLGCVIQGETRHFDFICQAVALGLTELTIKYNKPVIFGVLTTNTLDQAKERAGGKYGNKGFEAGITAIKMAALFS